MIDHPTPVEQGLDDSCLLVLEKLISKNIGSDFNLYLKRIKV